MRVPIECNKFDMINVNDCVRRSAIGSRRLAYGGKVKRVTVIILGTARTREYLGCNGQNIEIN